MVGSFLGQARRNHVLLGAHSGERGMVFGDLRGVVV